MDQTVPDSVTVPRDLFANMVEQLRGDALGNHEEGSLNYHAGSFRLCEAGSCEAYRQLIGQAEQALPQPEPMRPPVLVDVHRWKWYLQADGRYLELLTRERATREQLETRRGPMSEPGAAARWILVCDAGHLPTSTTYATEAAAREVLAMHTTACTGGHTVHLVSPAPSVELVQA